MAAETMHSGLESPMPVNLESDVDSPYLSKSSSPFSADESAGQVSATDPSIISADEGARQPSVTDPSVIIGMACRVPGATNPSQLWDVIAKKQDLRREIPPDRFNVDAFYHPVGGNKGTTNARYGYFLDQGLDQFDAQFFNISGKEAEAMDPQQRILLEVVYEALETAGITLDDISGTQTSVYCGSFTNDYNAMITKDLADYPKYTITGTGNAILSNRISFYYNLHGPSMTIDTACSSSLVCFHLANNSIQSRESEISIVAGSALHFDPNIFVTMTDFGMLSVDGRCRSFDADGSGYVRGDGICAIILKRKSAAERAGNDIRAIVRGTGANHDGLKEGLTVPNSEAQANLIRQTYKCAGISTADTFYFESHGTGTAAGDPREAKAIGDVFGPARSHPLVVGSIKSNLGHLEGASGLAGIIKASMSVEAGEILPNMHFQNPNPHIDFDGLKLQVPTELMDWNTTLRRASINSFGYGGANAHVILENYSSRRSETPENSLRMEVKSSRPFLLPLTTHSHKGGEMMIKKIRDYLTHNPKTRYSDLCYSYSTKRSLHPLRSFYTGKDLPSFLNTLAEPEANQTWTRVLGSTSRLGFVFTGQGAQYFSMGRSLIEDCPLFHQTLMKCDKVLQDLPDKPNWSCITELMKSSSDSQLHRSLYSQPLCTALQLALVDVLASWGIRPSAVIGHSSGEIAAAYAAGALTFSGAIICAYYRGLYMSKGVGLAQGAMLAVGMTEAEGKAIVENYRGRIALAAINSPSSLTLSGDEDAILELKTDLDSRKVFARKLQVEQAFHSHHMVPLAPGFEEALTNTRQFEAQPASCTMFSSVTARDSSARIMDASYFASNMVNTVRFSDALIGILFNDEEEANVDILIEIGAHPALKGPSRQTLKSLGLSTPYIASLSREKFAFDSLLSCAGQLFALGFPVDLGAVNSNHYLTQQGGVVQQDIGRRLKDLPTYSWDHGSYWAGTRLTRQHLHRRHRHSVLGALVPGNPPGRPRWRSYLRQSELPWLWHHSIDGKAIFPAAGYIALAIEAMAATMPKLENIHLRDVVFKSGLVLSSSDSGTEIVLDLELGDVWSEFSVYSFDENDQGTKHCYGFISTSKSSFHSSSSGLRFNELKKNSTISTPASEFYDHLNKVGLQYGESFQLITGNIESGPRSSVAKLCFDPTRVINIPEDSFILHPTLLDASFHAIFAALEAQTGQKISDAHVPTFLRSVSIGEINEKDATKKANYWVTADTKSPGLRISTSDVTLFSELSDKIVVEVKGLETTALGLGLLADQKRSLFFRIRWLDAFQFLQKDQKHLGSLADLVDCYTHQFSNAKILHVTSNPATAKELFQRHESFERAPRRYESLEIFPNPKDDKNNQIVGNGLSDLLKEDITEKIYDLVIIENHCDLQASSLINNDGYVVTAGVEIDTTGLELHSQAGESSVWKRMGTHHVDLSSDMLLIISPNASRTTLDLALTLENNYPGNAQRVSLSEASKLDTASNVVSLLSLDEDLLFSDQSSSSQYPHIQVMLTRLSGSFVWLLAGASQCPSNPAQALMLGLLRTVRNENTDLRLTTLDLPLDFSTQLDRIASLCMEVLDTSVAEDELVLKISGQLLIPRMEVEDQLNIKIPHAANRLPLLQNISSSGLNLALVFGQPGRSESLHYSERCFDSELGDEEVEIGVKASALSDRDLALASGEIDEKFLGDQCAGVILRAGILSGFQPGERVVSWRPGLGAHAALVRNWADLTKKIGDTDFVTASALPHILTTAYFALIYVGRLQPGEICLIHLGFTPVGQMMIRFAQKIGARVLVTCSTDSERLFIQENFGIHHAHIFLLDAATLVDEIQQATNGCGCNVIVNDIKSGLHEVSDNCVAPFGRIIDLKHQRTTSTSPPAVGTTSTRAVADISLLYELTPKLAVQLFNESYALAEEIDTTMSTPTLLFPRSKVREAFEALETHRSEHVVLVPCEEPLMVAPSAYNNSLLFDASKTYLIVGGLGGIGRRLSKWMFRRGARDFAFLSRSGAVSALSKEAVHWLVERGAKATVYTGDVSNHEDVKACITSIGTHLGGLFQAAMVLRDSLLADMTLDQWRECLRPKVDGTYALHQATIGHDLDFFICFSSFSAQNGSMGQSNYAAANTYIDALMRHRQSLGLPGFSMNVGMVKEIGFVSENAGLEKIMERNGWDPVTEEELYYHIEEALSSQLPSSSSTNGRDEHQLTSGIGMSRKDLFWAAKPMFRNLYANIDIDSSAQSTSRNLAVELATSPENRKSILTDALIEKMSVLLAIPSSNIQPSNSLLSYGLDSIVAADFRKWFSKSVGVDLALFDILGSKSISSLVDFVCGRIEQLSTTQAADRSEGEGADMEKPLKSRSNTSLDSEIPAQGLKTEHIPMSTFQNRIWFLHNMDPDSSALNLSVTLFLDGRPHLESLQKAFHRLAMRNEIMRTSYFEGDDFSEQSIITSFTTQIQTLNLSDELDPLKQLESHSKSLRDAPLQLEEGEIIRATLVQLQNSHFALVLAFHHIMLDNGGTKSFLDQFVGLYNAYRNGVDISKVSAPKISYVDFTLWHNQKLKSPEIMQDLAWWKEYLAGVPQFNKLLPFAQQQRGIDPSRDRRIIRRKIRRTIIKRMKRACSRLDITPFQFLLATLRAFIFRYTEEDDLTILMIDGNRPHPNLDDVLGYFVNVVPIRCNNDCDDTFDNLLGSIKKTVLDALAHSRVPFDKIVDAMKTRVSSHFPLGQIAFNYQMYGKAPKYKAADFELSDIQIVDIPTACEMALEATEDRESALDLKFEYDSYLYGANDMDRFLENFVTFLQSAVLDFRQPIEEVFMCGAKELKYLETRCWKSELNLTSWEDKSVYGRFAQMAQLYPDNTAIKTSASDSITYRDLHTLSGGIFTALFDAQVLPGSFVGILAYPGIDTIAAMIGISWARCAYVPLDPTFATGRLEHFARDSGVSAILVGKGLADLADGLVPNCETKVLSLADSSQKSITLPYYSYLLSDPMYIVYTSGSTGKPKGVVVTQEGTRAMLIGHNYTHGMHQDDVFLSATSMSFDISVTQIWGPLTCGAAIALALQDVRKDPVELARFMRSSEVTICYFTPTHFGLLLEHNSQDLRLCSKLRTALLIGEHLPPRLVKAVYDLKTPATVYNEYGPSEATAQNTIHKAAYPLDGDTFVSIGYPLSNSSIHVTDPRLRPVPAAVSGELCIGGGQIAQGYINRQQATKSAFVTNPFANELFESQGWTKLYRSGDKAHFLRNGELRLRGRLSGDKEIKLRGFRIDQSEIENELHDASKSRQDLTLLEVAVLARELSTSSSMADERQLVAFIVPKATDNRTSIISALHQKLSESLNEYMLPNGYQIMESLPKLVSGKMDRVQLSSMKLSLIHPFSENSGLDSKIIGDLDDDTLSTTINLIRSVLKLPAERVIEPSENFFDLGGQSVLLLRLQASLKRKFEQKIPLTDLFEHSTAEGIGQLIHNRLQSKQNSRVGVKKTSTLDWTQEASLPETDRFKPKARETKLEIASLLLLGAESFIGVHMLYYFLRDSSATVFVLGSRQIIKQEEMGEAFKTWNLFDSVVTRDHLNSRVHYVQGSLHDTHFGLDEASFDRLGTQVQAIYHAGGHVSLLKSYTSLRQSNVQSVVDAIELASVGNSELHYVSTWSVLHLQSWNTAQRSRSRISIAEENPSHFVPGPGDNLGYFKTRWVAEMLMTEASKRGFSVSVYRTSGLSASTRSNLATPADNFTINLILGMIEAGHIPETDSESLSFTIDFLPVDYIASCITRLGSYGDSSPKQPRFYHINNPSPMTLKRLADCMDQLRLDGRKGIALPVEQWADAMLGQSTSEAEQLEWKMFLEYLKLGHTMFSLDSSSTMVALKDIDATRGPSGVECPSIGVEYLREMLRKHGKRVKE